jgi:hypothetical protein
VVMAAIEWDGLFDDGLGDRAGSGKAPRPSRAFPATIA